MLAHSPENCLTESETAENSAAAGNRRARPQDRAAVGALRRKAMPFESDDVSIAVADVPMQGEDDERDPNDPEVMLDNAAESLAPDT